MTNATATTTYAVNALVRATTTIDGSGISYDQTYIVRGATVVDGVETYRLENYASDETFNISLTNPRDVLAAA